MTSPNVFPLGAHRLNFPTPPPTPLYPGRVRQPQRYVLSADADVNVRWLVAELGRRGLSGYFRRGDTLALCHRIGQDGYTAPRGTGDENGPATIRTASATDVLGTLALDYRSGGLVGVVLVQRRLGLGGRFPGAADAGPSRPGRPSARRVPRPPSFDLPADLLPAGRRARLREDRAGL